MATRIRWVEVDWYLRARLRRAGLLNGCGSKGGWFRPPEKLYLASCDQHDFNYLLGGGPFERRKADRQFLSAMLEDASAQPWWTRPWHFARALSYYAAVRLFGGPHFRHGDELSSEDLTREIGRAERDA